VDIGALEIEMLNVVTMLWGDWGGKHALKYVHRLCDGVKKNLSLDYRFICFTDRPSSQFDGDVICLPMDVPDWRWNLRKLILYKPNNRLVGRVLAFDLDVVITGSLDDIAECRKPFVTCEAAYHKGKVGGSLIGFEAEDYLLKKCLWNPIIRGKQCVDLYESITGGSERKYLQYQMDNFPQLKIHFWQDELPGQVVSYKVDCQKGIPENARVVRFHGSPRPHEVGGVYWS
jgi:hypothetical protein